MNNEIREATKNKLMEAFKDGSLNIHSMQFYGEKTLMCKVIVDGYFEPCRIYKQIITEKLKEIDPNTDIIINVMSSTWF